MEKLSKIFIVACLLLLISSLTVLAYTTWTHTYTWTVTKTKEFKVYSDSGYSLEWQTGLSDSLGTDPSTPFIKIFYFKSFANSQITITATITQTGTSIASYSWNPASGSITLPSNGDTGSMELTISSFGSTGGDGILLISFDAANT